MNYSLHLESIPYRGTLEEHYLGRANIARDFNVMDTIYALHWPHAEDVGDVSNPWSPVHVVFVHTRASEKSDLYEYMQENNLIGRVRLLEYTSSQYPMLRPVPNLTQSLNLDDTNPEAMQVNLQYLNHLRDTFGLPEAFSRNLDILNSAFG